ncbi:MAG: hypothetical protein AVDCRST_MAG40-3133, partial [uncultured Gemmatimonadaceae bacterium]
MGEHVELPRHRGHERVGAGGGVGDRRGPPLGHHEGVAHLAEGARPLARGGEHVGDGVHRLRARRARLGHPREHRVHHRDRALGRVARVGGEAADLVGHHGEAGAVLARAGRLHRGVEGEQLALARHLLHERDEGADLLRRRGHALDRRGAGGHLVREHGERGGARVEARAVHVGERAQAGVALHPLARAVGELAGDRDEAAGVAVHLLERLRHLGGLLAQNARRGGDLVGRGAHLLGAGGDLGRHRRRAGRGVGDGAREAAQLAEHRGHRPAQAAVRAAGGRRRELHREVAAGHRLRRGGERVEGAGEARAHEARDERDGDRGGDARARGGAV